mgnify:CR=1 FL=1
MFGPAGTYGIITIVSGLAWGLGYFGQPHILVRFMGISSPQAIKKSRRIATIWVLISLTAAIMIGVSGRMFLGDSIVLTDGNQETIYISMVAKIFPVFIAGIFLSAILAAIMSTADSQLLVTASAITEDFYHNKIRPNASTKELMWVSRGCVMAVALIAVLIATNQNSTVLGLVEYAWAGFGSAFGPLVLCSCSGGAPTNTARMRASSSAAWSTCSGRRCPAAFSSCTRSYPALSAACSPSSSSAWRRPPRPKRSRTNSIPTALVKIMKRILRRILFIGAALVLGA